MPRVRPPPLSRAGEDRANPEYIYAPAAAAGREADFSIGLQQGQSSGFGEPGLLSHARPVGSTSASAFCLEAGGGKFGEPPGRPGQGWRKRPVLHNAIMIIDGFRTPSLFRSSRARPVFTISRLFARRWSDF